MNNDRDSEEIEINGRSVLAKGNGDEQVKVSPAGIYVQDGDSEVKVGLGGPSYTTRITATKPAAPRIATPATRSFTDGAGPSHR